MRFGQGISLIWVRLFLSPKLRSPEMMQQGTVVQLYWPNR